MKFEIVASTAATNSNLDVDYMPAAAARISFNKHGESFYKFNDDQNKKLIKYLKDHKHMGPFEHVSVTAYVEVPIYIARQWMRHRTFAYNEVSMRYTKMKDADFYIPGKFRSPDESNKQGSTVELEDDLNKEALKICNDACDNSLKAYEKLIELGVAKEQARSVLPVNTYTKFYATANLRNWAHWYGLRNHKDAQGEIRILSDMVNAKMQELYPFTWGVLTNEA